jgi:phospholipid transport system substrate-binding protein
MPMVRRRAGATFAACAALAVLSLLVPTRSARAADPQAATAFVQTVSSQAIQILRQTGDRAALESAFQKLMEENVDMPRVARFTLAKYWRQASPQQQQEYERLFKTYMVHIYSSRLSQYAGETVKVTGATPQNDNQVLVHSQITRPNGQPPVDVDWRVRQDAQGNKLVDIVVEGISMAITQRSEFASIIDNNGGNIDVLLQKMRAVVG